MSVAPEARVATGVAAPRLSLVLPVYNGARYLDAAIASVLAQEFADFELICVDDGSRDATPAMLAGWAARDPRIRIVTNNPNRGLPATLNRGFAEAGGALHSWTSHDNVLRPAMLATLVAALDADPAVDVAYAGYQVIDAEDRPLRYVAPRPIATRWTGNPVGAAFVYRAGVTAALGGYDETLFGAEDYDFWLRAARQFRFKPIDADLYLYRRHDESLTDRRMAEIKDKVAALVLRDLDHAPDRKTRAQALVHLALDDRSRLRRHFLADAWAADPATTLAAAPRIIRHAARAMLG